MYKVHIFLEGHKFEKKIPHYMTLPSKVKKWEIFKKIFWPSQNI